MWGPCWPQQTSMIWSAMVISSGLGEASRAEVVQVVLTFVVPFLLRFGRFAGAVVAWGVGLGIPDTSCLQHFGEVGWGREWQNWRQCVNTIRNLFVDLNSVYQVDNTRVMSYEIWRQSRSLWRLLDSALAPVSIWSWSLGSFLCRVGPQKTRVISRRSLWDSSREA